MASTWARLLDAAAALATYLRLLVVSWPLKINYDGGDLRIGLLGAAIVLAAILSVALTARRSAGRAGPAAAVWVVGFLIPVLGIVRIQASSIAERFLYLPSAGLAWFVALMLDRVRARTPARRVAAAGLFALVGLLATGSVLRARVWKDETTLFEDAIRQSPAYLDGYTNLATAHGRAGRHEDAIRVLQRALEIAPDSPAVQLNLGSALGAQGRTEEAIQCFRRAVALEPGSVDGLTNLATAYLTLGRTTEAAAALESAVRADPESVTAQALLGHALLALGQSDAALARFQRALALNPRDGMAHFGVGLVSLARGDLGEAERQQRILVGLDPALAEQLASRMARAGR
jgi:Tfp pilus assembly protein PilF